MDYLRTRTEEQGPEYSEFVNPERVSINSIPFIYDRKDHVNGCQLNILGNEAGELNGAQISGSVNIADRGIGVQAAGLVNLVTEEFTGVQLAGLLCYAKDGNFLQLGLVTVRGGEGPWYKRASPIVGWKKKG